jgi:hypothetical protein
MEAELAEAEMAIEMAESVLQFVRSALPEEVLG